MTAPRGFVYGPNNQVIDTPYARLYRAALNPASVAPDAAPDPGDPPPASGIPNPYGQSLYAFEPNTEPWGTTDAPNAMRSTVDMANSSTGIDTRLPEPGVRAPANYTSGGVAQANGLVARFISAAMDLAARRVPYVWGGTSATGVDCSGLLFYAAKAAGIPDWKRYVASDYGRMGTQVSGQDARPGDIVYYDNPGPVDHVGIYIGNGQMVVAPQSGETVKVQAVYGRPTYRRVFDDTSFAAVLTPGGGTTYSYNGRPYSPAGGPALAAPPAASPMASTTSQSFLTATHAKAV